jgi:hypothetical protein
VTVDRGKRSGPHSVTLGIDARNCTSDVVECSRITMCTPHRLLLRRSKLPTGSLATLHLGPKARRCNTLPERHFSSQ